MSKLFTTLKRKDLFTLAAIMVISFLWLMVDQVFLDDTSQRFIALALLLLILFFLQFLINKPQTVFRYATAIGLIVLSFAIILTIILHVIINHDFSMKSVLIWLMAFLFPFTSAGLFVLYRKLK